MYVLEVVADVVPGDHLELNLRVGDVVGVIQQKDPMGNRNRWFCDNGIAQVGLVKWIFFSFFFSVQ